MAQFYSYLDQFRDAKTGAGKWNAGIQGGLAAVGGIGSLMSPVKSLARTEDMTGFNDRLGTVNGVGLQTYRDLGSLSDAYSMLGYGQVPTYDQVRGTSVGQQIGLLGGTMLSGASTGLTVGGPWGAAIGAGIGALAGGIGMLKGNKDAENKVLVAGADASYVGDSTRARLGRQREGIIADDDAKSQVRSLGCGGSMQRRLEHRKGEGGTIVRLRRKKA